MKHTIVLTGTENDIYKIYFLKTHGKVQSCSKIELNNISIKQQSTKYIKLKPDHQIGKRPLDTIVTPGQALDILLSQDSKKYENSESYHYTITKLQDLI